MKKYDYRRVITDAIKDWIVNETDILEEGIVEGRDDDLYNWIYDEVFDDYTITGNGYRYYDSEDMCSEYLANNFDLLYEAVHEFAIDDEINVMIKHYEDKDLARYFDCTIRCYLLMDCIYAAIEELEAEGKIKHSENWDPDA